MAWCTLLVYVKGVLMVLHVRGSTSRVAATLSDVEERLFVTAKRGGCRVSLSRGEDVAGLNAVAYRSGSEVEYLVVRR